MGQVFKNYWTSTSKKPKGFKSIGSNIYEYEVTIKVFNKNHKPEPEYEYYTEMIPTHYRCNKRNERLIELEQFRGTLKKMIGVDTDDCKSGTGGSVNEGWFRRDGASFPFIEYVLVPSNQSEKYLQFRDMRDRVRKINQLRKKMS